MMKRLLIVILAGMFSYTIGFTFISNTIKIRAAMQPRVFHGSWVSAATTVAEQVAEADLIVQVQVDKVHNPRTLEQVLKPDLQGTKGKDMLMVAPFTDSDMRVITVYKGSIGHKLTVTQTGGIVPATDKHPLINDVMEGDPLFVLGSQHILFLKDISGDSVHAPGRQLYRIVNPAGRYEIQGSKVVSINDFPDSYTPPSTINELTSQIQQILDK